MNRRDKCPHAIDNLVARMFGFVTVADEYTSSPAIVSQGRNSSDSLTDGPNKSATMASTISWPFIRKHWIVFDSSDGMTM